MVRYKIFRPTHTTCVLSLYRIRVLFISLLEQKELEESARIYREI